MCTKGQPVSLYIAWCPLQVGANASFAAQKESAKASVVLSSLLTIQLVPPIGLLPSRLALWVGHVDTATDTVFLVGGTRSTLLEQVEGDWTDPSFLTN